MSNVELKVDPAELAQLKPYLEKNDFKEAYRLIRYHLSSNTRDFTRLFLDCGIDPLEYMDKVPENYAYDLKNYQFSIPKHIKRIEKWAFAGTDIDTANLENIYQIYDYAFKRCESLTSIKFGDNLQIIPYGCFAYCTSLKTVELPVNIFCVEAEAFEDCNHLSHVIIHNPDCDINNRLRYSSFKKCKRNMLIEVRSEKLANEFIEKGFKNVNIF